MSKFLTDLSARLCDDDRIWFLLEPLVYDSEILGLVIVPSGFTTDFASVPRVPFIYWLYGDRAHRESVIHDYLYRIDSAPVVGFSTANRVFLESMACRGKSLFVRLGMFLGVCIGGAACYHIKEVNCNICPTRHITT